jgi:ribosomal protein S4
MPIGTVKFFNDSKGYGFIQPEDGSKDVFVHISAVEQSGLGNLVEGQRVSYELEQGQQNEARLKEQYVAKKKQAVNLDLHRQQLREKQKARRIYGVLEAQFRRYYREALKSRGVTGQVLLQILECRLDNVVYRMGYAANRAQARNLVTHGHFNVNGRRIDVPSMLLGPGDTIEVRATSP